MDKLLVMGGGGKDSTYLNDIWSSIDGNTWTEEEEVKDEKEDGVISWCPRRGHAVAVLNEKLYIMGGVTTRSMTKICDDECSEGGGGEEAASEVQQPTAITTHSAASSSSPQLLSSPTFCCSSTSPFNHVYLCDCFVLSYKSELIVIIVQSIQPKNLYL